MIIPRTPSLEPSATTSIDASALSLLSESDIRRLALERLRDTQVRQTFNTVNCQKFEAWLVWPFAIVFGVLLLT